MSAGPDDDAFTRDHFWFRPGWSPGRAYLTWHVVVDDDPAALHAIRPWSDRLRGSPELEVVAPERLHLTVQGVGFGDEVEEQERAAVVSRVGEELAALPQRAVRLSFSAAYREGVSLVAGEPGVLDDVRAAVRRGVAAAGLDVPGAEHDPFRPHVSLAYATGRTPRQPVRDRLDGLDDDPPLLHVRGLTLLALRMEPPGYEWDVLARVPLRGAPTSAV